MPAKVGKINLGRDEFSLARSQGRRDLRRRVAGRGVAPAYFWSETGLQPAFLVNGPGRFSKVWEPL